jgi:hypothetical protein
MILSNRTPTPVTADQIALAIELVERALAAFAYVRSAATTHTDLATSLTTITAWFRLRRAKTPAAPSPAESR